MSAVEYVTTNEHLVRQRIFDGVLPNEDGYKELYELERSQHAALWLCHVEMRDKLGARIEELVVRLREHKA